MNVAVDSLGPGAAGGHLARRLLGFLHLLRDNGLPVGLRESADAFRGMRDLPIDEPASLRAALRTLLCGSPREWRRFGELFDLYWLGLGTRHETRVSRAGGRGAGLETSAPGDLPGPHGPPQQILRGEGLEAEGGEGRRGGATAAESLEQVDLRHINDPDELARVNELTERLAARMRYRLSRRERKSRRGRRLDLRKVIHNSVATGGAPFKLAYRKRWPKPLRLVVILDASGSMSLYSTFFLRFLRGVLNHFREAEAFVFHTRLIHISQALREKNTERALERMSLMAAGWAGGTRIGESLAAFNRHHARRAINRRTALIIVSDGYDTGPPELLAREMERLKKRAHRVIWLNPMIGWRDYQPTAAGMAAALPFVDVFAPAHNLESLAALEPVLAKL